MIFNLIRMEKIKFCTQTFFSVQGIDIRNIAKGTTDLRVEFLLEVHSSQYTNLIELQFQNINKALTSKSQPNISISTKSKVKILTKPSFRILTKIQLRNLNQTSTVKY